MRTGIYARVSTQRQAQADGIVQQLDRLRAHALQQGWTVAAEHIFRDDGYSGARLTRPGLERLRDCAALHELDRVLITAPDRLARNYVHQVLLLEEITATGCQVEFLDRPMSQDPHDQLLLQIRGAVAEYERSLIVERMRRGRLRKLQAGILLPWTRPPYGYRVDPDRPGDPAGVRIDTAPAAVVAEIYAWYADGGRSLFGLATKLQRDRVAPPAPSQTVCSRISATAFRSSETERRVFKGRHFDRSVILLCVRWYLAYNLSLRNLEEMMAERGISVDHATVHRWVVRYSPELLERFNLCKRSVSRKWHVDETYIKVRGQWKYLYRAIDSYGDTVEFWFSERRNLATAKRFLHKALKRHGRPERIVIDGSQTNREAILSCDAESRLQDHSRRRLKPIRIRQSQYLNNRIEQDHRAVKRRVRSMLGFKSADSARVILGGIELIHMLRKQQAKYVGSQQLSLAEQFHLLAA